jgi:hypothetical protein
MPQIDSQQRAELRNKTHVVTEDDAHCVYLIPDEHVDEYFNYGKPNSAMSKILARELAKEIWGMNEKEAVENSIEEMTEERSPHWKVIVYRR